jgi:hypothetical protein
LLTCVQEGNASFHIPGRNEPLKEANLSTYTLVITRVTAICHKTKKQESNFHRNVNFRTHCDIDRHSIINLHLILQVKLQVLAKNANNYPKNKEPFKEEAQNLYLKTQIVLRSKHFSPLRL